MKKSYWYWTSIPFDTLKDKTFVSVERVNDQNGDEIRFVMEDKTTYRLYHSQDCCEDVFIEDIVGDLSDLIGTPILVAEERVGEGPKKYEWDESFTWTFYTLRTIKGSVDIRWYGSSNGYYSESVDLYEYQEHNR